MSKNVLWVFAHPEPASLSGALMRVGVERLRDTGLVVEVSDLHAMGWNAVASAADFPGRDASKRLFYMADSKLAYEQGAQADDVALEQEKLRRCDVLIVQFPLWWFGMPAILKGWFDRVFANGFAYGLQDPEWPGRSLRYGKGGLEGRRAMVITTAAARQSALGPRGVGGAIDDLLFPVHHGLLWYTGMTVLSPFVVYSAGRLQEEEFPVVSSSLIERLDTLDSAPAIPFRYQNSSDYDDGLALMPGLEGDATGFEMHLRRDRGGAGSAGRN